MPRDINLETTRTAREDHFEPGEKLLWQGRPDFSLLGSGAYNGLSILTAIAISAFFLVFLLQELSGINTDPGLPPWLRITLQSR